MGADNMMLTLARQVLAAQPFSKLVGAEIESISEGKVEIHIPIRPELLQQNGFVHGGVLSYAADNAITFAGGSVLGPGVVTSEYKISYLRPAVGAQLRVVSSAVGRGKRQVVCMCEIFAVAEGESKLCAVALGTVSVIDARST